MRVRTLLGIGLFVLGGCGGTHTYEFDGATMGTYYSVKSVVPDSVDKRAVGEGIRETVERIDGLMSTYKPDSELSRFNRAPVGVWFPISRESAEVIGLAQQVSGISDGDFDITVGPLVNLWGFGPDPSNDRIPSDEAIAAAREEVGYRKLELRRGHKPALRKSGPLYVDLSAVAKGYAVDKVAEFLESERVTNYLVDIGGEMRVAGVKEGGVPWRVAIQSPAGGEEMARVLVLEDLGVATSGDYRNYFEVDGVRYSHTIDPRTGRPIRHNLASVTVLDRSAARADALATALDVMGPERGMALAQRIGLPVLLITKEQDGFREHASAAFEPYLASAKR